MSTTPGVPLSQLKPGSDLTALSQASAEDVVKFEKVVSCLFPFSPNKLLGLLTFFFLADLLSFPSASPTSNYPQRAKPARMSTGRSTRTAYVPFLPSRKPPPVDCTPRAHASCRSALLQIAGRVRNIRRASPQKSSTLSTLSVITYVSVLPCIPLSRLQLTPLLQQLKKRAAHLNPSLRTAIAIYVSLEIPDKSVAIFFGISDKTLSNHTKVLKALDPSTGYDMAKVEQYLVFGSVRLFFPLPPFPSFPSFLAADPLRFFPLY